MKVCFLFCFLFYLYSTLYCQGNQPIMKLRNNEDSSQVLANPVESVQCPGGLGGVSMSQDGVSPRDDVRPLGERCCVSDVGVSRPTPTPPLNKGSPSRTPKHKKHNPRRLSLTNTEIGSLNCSREDTRRIPNQREMMECVMFSPVDDLAEENSSITINYGKAPSTIDYLTGLCGDGKLKCISKCDNLNKRCELRIFLYLRIKL